MIARGLAAFLMTASLAPAAALAQPAAPPDSEIKAAVNAIYARYRATPIADEMPLFTKRMRDLITRWHKSQPKDEVTPLGDFDWFCQCQDFDSKTFAVKAIALRKGAAGAYEANVAYNIGWDGDQRLRLVMMVEEGGWKVDDILFAPDTGIKSLRAGLEGEIRDAAK